MIANLITTLLLALGVATGSYQSESGNAFNHVIENKQTKPIQKATDIIQTSFSKVAEWHNSSSQDAYYTDYEKYYIHSQYGDEPLSPNYVLPNMIIYNSIYTLSYRYTDSGQYSGLWCSDVYYIYKLINIYSGNTYFDLDTLIVVDQTNTNNKLMSWGYENYISGDQNIENIIDLTMNGSSRTTIENTYNSISKQLLNQNRHSGEEVADSKWIDITSNQITLQEDETIYLIMHAYHQYYPDNINISTDIILENQMININYIAPTQTTEIVNVPELMFTIVTLPFAFYSTAFNLTIFPNTPYALNFGNLILTILAALILLYLIKKVLK